MIGRTGSGKSATANTILGSKMFVTELAGTAVTKVTARRSSIRFNKNIVIVDTPGVFDTEGKENEIKEEICKCIGISSPGPHAFILVLDIAKQYTEEDRCTIKLFEQIFGKEMYRYSIILFTRKDQLDKNRTTLEEYIQKSPKELQFLIKECGERVFALDNTRGNGKQVKRVQKLLNMISDNVTRNVGKCYTRETLAKAAEEFEKEEQRREQELIKKREEERQEFQNKIKEETTKRLEEERENYIKMQNEYERKLANIRNEVREDIAKSRFDQILKFGSSIVEFLLQYYSSTK